MKKKATELEFISQIKRDGSGTHAVDKDYLEMMNISDESFEVRCLSFSQGTYIAMGFNSFVVRLKSYINSEVKKVSESDLKKALSEVNQKNKEIRESFNIDNDFRVI